VSPEPGPWSFLGWFRAAVPFARAASRPGRLWGTDVAVRGGEHVLAAAAQHQCDEDDDDDDRDDEQHSFGSLG
jgi:hypothetical protein